MQVHPDNVHLTAVMMPFGLYEWLAMSMGLRNSPPIHQWWMAATLWELLGKICHIYLDKIVIWSDNVEQHTKHIQLVLAALRKAKLYCNPKNAISTYLKWISWDITSPHVALKWIPPRLTRFWTGLFPRIQQMSTPFSVWYNTFPGIFHNWRISCESWCR